MAKMNYPALAGEQGGAVFQGSAMHSEYRQTSQNAIDFAAVNRAALDALPAVLNRLLPRGKRAGNELVALNPNRRDTNPGSFKVNRFNCKWADFATGDRGGDPVSLVAYLEGCSQLEAAKKLASMLGLDDRGRA